jgi:dihydrolipoamide dehydrogenase
VTVQVTASDGSVEEIAADKLLMAVGRRPLTENIGLEAADVKMERGFIVVDGYMRSSSNSIFGIGDCVTVAGQGPHLQLAHVASVEGILAVETIAGQETRPVDYNAVPRAVYSRPEVSSIGLTEAQALEQGYDVKIGKFPMRANSKASILGERVGSVKIVADGRYGEILGMHMVGPGAPELVAEVAVAKRLESTVEELARSIHAHPTVSETIREAAEAALGMAIDI